MKKILHIIAMAIVCALGLGSCIDDSFTTDPSDLLGGYGEIRHGDDHERHCH